MTANNQMSEANLKYLAEFARQAEPSGYKHTEVGMIPDDWNILSISEVASKITDGTHDTPRPVKEGFPFLTAIHVKDGRIDFEKCYFLPERIHKEIFRRCNPEFGDILMVNIGAGTATTAVVNVNYEFSLKNVALIKPNQLNNGFYINYALAFSKEKIVESISTGGAQPFLSLSQIARLKIASPKNEEQTAIANALSDVDALIHELEKLIAKKQGIKTAAMQQLLTGRIRLPQFALHEDGTFKGYKQSELEEIPEDWECVSIAHCVSSVQLGGNYANSELDTAYPLIKMGNMGRGSITLEKLEYIQGKPNDRDKLKYGDVLFNTRNTLELVGKVSMWRDELPEAYFNSNILRFNFNESCVASSVYMNAIMNSRQFIFALASIATGTTSVAAIYTRDLFNIKLPLATKPEQTAIATILSDMDEEIQTLQKRLAKTRQIKQGMMQELLTGKTRLVKPALKEFANV